MNGRWDEARAHVAKALRFDTENALLQYHAGIVALHAGDLAEVQPSDLPNFLHQGRRTGVLLARVADVELSITTNSGARYYWPGNEPGLETPGEYDFAGAPWRTQSVVRQIMSLYPAATYGIPGNDDLGSLSAWYVWASLGMYPAIPGVGGVALATHVFRWIDVRLPKGMLHIEGRGAPAGAAFCRSFRIDGRPWHSRWLPPDLLGAGHQLTFRLEASADPSARRWMNTPGPSFP